MHLEGTVYRQRRILRKGLSEIPEDGPTFTHNLDRSLLSLCKNLAIPLPVWMSKNTREFAAWRQTEFTDEQFGEPVLFDRFHIRLTE